MSGGGSGEALNSYLRVDRISQGDDDASVKSEPDITQPLLPPEMLLTQPIESPMLQRVKEVYHSTAARQLYAKHFCECIPSLVSIILFPFFMSLSFESIGAEAKQKLWTIPNVST